MKNTFWSLISENSIEIPIIQRDYAQGRKEEKRIAENFVNALHNSIVQGTKLSLDFIYGKKTINNIFIPLDGQQRLTTLWLLHWYLAVKEGKLTNDYKNNLLKFSYETRLTSQDFCKKIVEESITFPNSDKSVSEVIKDAKWFYLSWEQDPTVAGMLNMLDSIHEKFKNEKKNYFDVLISKDSPVEFYFLNLEEFSLTDELYIKMNARGKPLTPFEYFKAQFSKLLDNDSRKKLDNTWMDIFWNIEKTANSHIHPQNVETKYYNFFENIALLIYVEDRDIDKEFFDNYDLLSFFDKDKSDKVVFNNENIENIGRTLDCLSNYRETIFTDFLKPHRSRAGEGEEKNEINYWERCRFYSLYQFFITQGAVNSQNSAVYKRWMRITKNLINNTRIDEPADFYRAIRSLKKLAQNIKDIYGYFKNLFNVKNVKDDIEFFYRQQVDEEKLKAHLILYDNTWEPLILEIENHPYFDGQTGFILEFAKDNNTYNKGKFKEYSDKLRKLFTDFKDSKDFLFQRALLAMGDYLVPIGINYTFCNFNEGLREKMDNWRKVFNDPQKVGYIKKLLDTISLSNMEEDLKNIIDNYNDKGWRYFFIKNPKVLGYCTQKQIRWIGNRDNNNNYPEVYLLSGIKMSSWHTELYTFYLFKTYLEVQDGVEYCESQSNDDLPYIRIKNNNESVTIKTIKDQFEIVSNDNDKIQRSIEDLIDELDKTPETDRVNKIISMVLTNMSQEQHIPLHVNIDEAKKRHVGGSYAVQCDVQKQCIEESHTA